MKRLHSAWEQLKVRHSILRTAFVATSPSSVIQVAFTAPGPSSQCDWSVVEFDGDFHQHVTEQVQVEYLKPSDLYTPPARATLVRVGQHFALLLSLHHATYGMSRLTRSRIYLNRYVRCLVRPTDDC